MSLICAKVLHAIRLTKRSVEKRAMMKLLNDADEVLGERDGALLMTG